MTLDDRITNIDNRGNILLAEFDNQFTVLYEKQKKGIVYAALPTDGSGCDSPTVRYLDGSDADFSRKAFEVELEHLRKMGEVENQNYENLCDKLKDLVGAEEIPYEKKRNWGMIGLSLLTLPLAPISVPLGLAVGYATWKIAKDIRGSAGIGIVFIGAGICAPLLFPLYGLSEIFSPSTDYMDLQKCKISNENNGEDLALYLEGSKDKCTSFEVIFPNGNSGSIMPTYHPKKEIQATFHSPIGFDQEQAINKYNEAKLFLEVDAEKRKNFEQAIQYHAERPQRFAAFEKEMERFDHKVLLEYAGSGMTK